MEATRAAGAMLIASDSGDRSLFFAAALVHVTVSVFWAAILVAVLPRRHTTWWAIAALAGIAILDLLVIGRISRDLRAGVLAAIRRSPRVRGGSGRGSGVSLVEAVEGRTRGLTHVTTLAAERAVLLAEPCKRTALMLGLEIGPVFVDHEDVGVDRLHR